MKINSPLLSVVFGLALASSLSYAQPKHAELKQEIEVMQGIFETALKTKDVKQAISIRSIKTTYLEGQGVIFELEISSDRSRIFLDADSINELLENIGHPNLLSESDLAPMFHIIDDFDGHLHEFTAQKLEQVQRALSEVSDEIRQLRDQERTAAWEQRELERSKRDLQFQLQKVQDKADKKELQEDVEKLEKQVAKIKAQKQAVKDKADKLAQQQNETISEQRQAKKQAYKAFLARLETKLSDSLCRFGAGLRALPQDQNVNFVLNNNRRNSADRVYVFKQKNIIQCVQTRIDAEKLLAEASIYEF